MPILTAYFESDVDTPMTAPTTAPTIRIRRMDTEVLVVTDASMDEEGDGLYSYTFAEDATLEYTFRCNGDPLAAGQTKAGGRYTSGSFSGITEARLETDIPLILADTAAMEPLVSTNLDATVSSRNSVVPLAAATDQAEHDQTQTDIAALTTPPTVSAIADGVWDEDLTGHLTALSAGEQLRFTQRDDAIFVDLTNGTAGTGASVGTFLNPSDNITDALSIMSTQSLSKMVILDYGGGTYDWTTAEVAAASSQKITVVGRLNASAVGGITIQAAAPGPETFTNCKFETVFMGLRLNYELCQFKDCNVTTPDAYVSNSEFIDCQLRTSFSVSWPFPRISTGIFLVGDNTFRDCFGKPGFAMSMDGFESTILFQRFTGELALETFAAQVSADVPTLDVNLLGATLDIDSANTDATAVEVSGIGAVTNTGSFTDNRAPQSQQIRDAMKLAPTAGAPAAGSVDEHLDDILTDTATTIPGLITALNDPTVAAIATEVWETVLSTASAASGDAAETLRTLEKIFTNDAVVAFNGGTGENEITIFDDDGVTVLRKMSVTTDGLTRTVLVGS